MSGIDPLVAPLRGAERRDVGGVKLEVVRAGDARVKRMIYPVGFRWSTNMKPLELTYRRAKSAAGAASSSARAA